MARKPSIILTVADKSSAAKDLRAEIKEQKAELKIIQTELKVWAKREAAQARVVEDLEARIATLKT